MTANPVLDVSIAGPLRTYRVIRHAIADQAQSSNDSKREALWAAIYAVEGVIDAKIIMASPPPASATMPRLEITEDVFVILDETSTPELVDEGIRAALCQFFGLKDLPFLRDSLTVRSKPIKRPPLSPGVVQRLRQLHQLFRSSIGRGEQGPYSLELDCILFDENERGVTSHELARAINVGTGSITQRINRERKRRALA